MNWIALNIPLAVVMFGLVTGLPLWVLRKYPETDRPVALDRSVLRVGSADAEWRPVADSTSSVAPARTESRNVDVGAAVICPRSCTVGRRARAEGRNHGERLRGGPSAGRARR